MYKILHLPTGRYLKSSRHTIYPSIPLHNPYYDVIKDKEIPKPNANGILPIKLAEKIIVFNTLEEAIFVLKKNITSHPIWQQYPCTFEEFEIQEVKDV